MSVVKLAEAEDVRAVGGKAAALGALIRAGFNVPAGFVVSGYDESEIMRAFDSLSCKYVAVRSSATAEDAKDAAWAGQFDTFINVTKNDLLNRVKQCFASGRSTRAQAYAKQKGLSGGKVAVIIQAMVQGEISGVAFSANPVTQNKDEMIIEAAFGLMKLLFQAG